MSARHLSSAERQRLVALLGMLGSDQPGERDNAARLAEKFRRQYGMTWADLLNLDALPPEPPKPEPPPQPKPKAEAPKPPPPPPSEAQMRSEKAARTAAMRFHTAGRAAYPDWDERWLSLVKIGDNNVFPQILIGDANGVMLTFELSSDLPAAKAIVRLLPGPDFLLSLRKFADALKAKSAPPPEPPQSTPPPQPAWRPAVPHDGLSLSEALLPVAVGLAGWMLMLMFILLITHH